MEGLMQGVLNLLGVNRDNDIDGYDPLSGAHPQATIAGVAAGTSIPPALLKPATLEDVVGRCYAAAKRSLHVDEGLEGVDMVPVPKSFLWDTWISFYTCQFDEEKPHTVRWIEQGHPLIVFFHWHELRATARCLRSESRPYGNIALYPETHVQRYLKVLVGLCREMNLPVDEDPGQMDVERLLDLAADGKGKAEEVPVNPEDATVPVGEEGVMTDISLAAETDEEAEARVANGLRARPTEMDTYIECVYREICAVKLDAREEMPTYDDLFYNMSRTYMVMVDGSKKAFWWMDVTHAFTRHPAIQRWQPADAFDIQYGKCLVYADQVIQDVVDAIYVDFQRMGLPVKVQARKEPSLLLFPKPNGITNSVLHHEDV